jgi:hypothetical protein
LQEHQQELGKKLLKRDRNAMALRRYEESCRTKDESLECVLQFAEICGIMVSVRRNPMCT